KIDAAVNEAIGRGELPGAVVLVLHKDKVVYRKAFGHRSLEPVRQPMTPDTLFDLASLTKPVCTATCVFALVDRGKIALSDPVAKHWPEFADNGKAEVTVDQLLVHTSGLIADNPLSDYADGKAKALERVAALKPEAPPGSRFRYSDVNFIALGELIERL